MLRNRLVNAVLTWIACFAVLMGVLAPALSQALPRDAGSGWTEVCSVMGVQMVRMDDGATSGPLDSQGPLTHTLEHCPYCSLHLSDLGLPPAGQASLALLPLDFQLPELFLLAPRPLFAWASAQARAPPLSV